MRSHRPLFAVLALAVGFAVALSLAEVGLRATGHTPWRFEGRESSWPTMHEPDPALGWRNKPGRHLGIRHAERRDAPVVTILPDHSRRTSEVTPRGGPKLLFVGGSFTQGWGISDEETFAWKIQQRFASSRVVNFGTGAYGTLQSLMVIERALESPDPPRAVVYGFIAGHEARNVASPELLQSLARHSHGGDVGYPYATLGPDDRLERHAPIGQPRWPLREQLALAALAEDRYSEWSSQGRVSQKAAVTDRLLLEMDRQVKAAGGEFYVVVFLSGFEQLLHYVQLFKQHDVKYMSCMRPLTREMRVPNDGHPNGAMNTIYAQCIAELLEGSATLRAPELSATGPRHRER